MISKLGILLLGTPLRFVVGVFLWSFPTQIVIAAFSRRLFGCLALLQVSSRSVVGKYRHEIPTEYSVAVFSRRFWLSCILLKTVSMLLVGKRTQKILLVKSSMLSVGFLFMAETVGFEVLKKNSKHY